MFRLFLLGMLMLFIAGCVTVEGPPVIYPDYDYFYVPPPAFIVPYGHYGHRGFEGHGHFHGGHRR